MAGCFEPCGAVKEIEQWMEPGVKRSPAWSASGAVSYLRLGRRGGAGAAGGRAVPGRRPRGGQLQTPIAPWKRSCSRSNSGSTLVTE